MHSYPDPDTIKALKEKYDTDQQSLEAAIDRKAKILFKINWYRVILDEAHRIKCDKSRSKYIHVQ